MVRLEVGIQDEEVKSQIKALKERIGNLLPVMKPIAETIRTSVIKNFETGGRPDKWKPSFRALSENGQTLVKSGRLRNSIWAKATPDTAVVGTNVKYAGIHQFGGRTAPHVIEPRKKKALFWLGALHPVRQVTHPGSNIPARPFLVIQNEDFEEIKRMLVRRITE